MIALGLVGAGICSFLLPGLPGIVWLAIFWTLESVGWAMAGPAEEAMVADLTGHQIRGTGYGLYTFVSSVGAAIGPLAEGTIIYRNLRGQYKVYEERSLKNFLAQLSHSEVAYELTHMFGLPEFPGYIIRFFDDGVMMDYTKCIEDPLYYDSLCEQYDVSEPYLDI